MIRFFIRVIATLILAVAVILAVIDATRSVASAALVMTPLGESWAAAFPSSLEALRVFLETRIAAFVWDPVTVGVLTLPGCLILAIVAFVLYAVGRKPPSRREGWE